jgi:hypothetical protein
MPVGVSRGYVSIQRFYIYAERGLARQRVSIWLYEGRLHIAYREALLARYNYRYDRKQQRLRTIEQPHMYKPHSLIPNSNFGNLTMSNGARFWSGHHDCAAPAISSLA